MPCVDVFEFNQDWSLYSKQRCLVEGLNYMHDICMVPDYYIIHITPFVKVSSWISFKIAAGWTSSGETMRHYPELPSKFVIIPRDRSQGGPIISVDTGHFHVSCAFCFFCVCFAGFQGGCDYWILWRILPQKFCKITGILAANRQSFSFTVKVLLCPQGLVCQKRCCGWGRIPGSLFQGGLLNLQVLGSAKHNVLYCFLHSQIAVS